MGTGTRVTIWLTAAAGLTAGILVMAAGAGASVSFNPQTRTGFIGRGDVIAAAGKGALIANPLVSYQVVRPFTETCTWPDGTSVQASGSDLFFLLFQAEARYAPGSRQITGYALSPADIIDGETSDPSEDLALCWQARGLPNDGSNVTQTFAYGPSVTTLTFFGPNGGVPLPLGR
jgi:hypothetical protein